MLDPERLLDLLQALDEDIDEHSFRRLAFEACGGDSLVLMTALVRAVRSLADQLADATGSSRDEILHIEAYVPVPVAEAVNG